MALREMKFAAALSRRPAVVVLVVTALSGGGCSEGALAGSVCAQSACEAPRQGGLCCGGACRDTTTDVDHCGGCWIVCKDGPWSTRRCANGRCQLACDRGHGDCNGVAGDGCETELETDQANCGACGKACGPEFPHQSVACVEGACRSVCTLGWTDCNTDSTDGCEAQLEGDPRNCGSCGVLCPAGAPRCVQGTCTPRRAVVVVHTDPTYRDAVAKLLEAQRVFERVDDIDVSAQTPTFEVLSQYSAALVYFDRGPLDTIACGDVLADYFEAGGIVVLAYAANASRQLGGRFQERYGLLHFANVESQPDRLGLIRDRKSPLLADVYALQGEQVWRSKGFIKNGGTVVAEWAGQSRPMIVVGTFGPRHVVSLNLFPVPASARPELLRGDIGPLLRNALLFR